MRVRASYGLADQTPSIQSDVRSLPGLYKGFRAV